MKKILVIYYSQTGQLNDIIGSVIQPFNNAENISISMFKIKPVKDFPFPWTSDDFFNVMPESVKGISTPFDLTGFPFHQDFDLVIFAYQVWFLSPSIPVTSFLLVPEVRTFFKNKNVLTLLGVRNMWIMAQERIKITLTEYGAQLVGNIVLTDKSSNFVSVITIIKWLIYGNKGPYKLFPPAGVSNEEIKNAIRFNEPIQKAIISGKYSELQNKLNQLKAVEIYYPTLQIEKTAIKIFHLFANFILRKGDSKAKKRLLRVRIFKYYLLFAIFVLFPFAFIVYRLKQIICHSKAKSEVSYYT